MRFLLCGILGHMGRAILAEAGEDVVAGIDTRPAPPDFSLPVYADLAEAPPAEAILDFSHPALTADLLAFAVSHDYPLVSGTTGRTAEQQAAIAVAAEKIPVFLSANFSLGMAWLAELAVQTARAFPQAQIEMVEVHHARKNDAPSGTALSLAQAIQGVRPQATLLSGRSGKGVRKKEEIGIHSLRLGQWPGMHSVLFDTEEETITLSHNAQTSAVYARGALRALAFLQHKPAGLYTMKDLISESSEGGML